VKKQERLTVRPVFAGLDTPLVEFTAGRKVFVLAAKDAREVGMALISMADSAIYTGEFYRFLAERGIEPTEWDAWLRTQEGWTVGEDKP
jgi:hypothetical protein